MGLFGLSVRRLPPSVWSMQYFTGFVQNTCDDVRHFSRDGGGELLSLAKYRDGGPLFCRSGFTPDMLRKDVGDKPRPTSEFRHSIVRGSVNQR